MSDLSVGLRTDTLAVTPGNTDVSGQIATAGVAFGDLVKLVGKAVADTQTALNKTAADSTTTLATTLVDMIAVQEIDYDDDGTITGSQTFKQKLPLIDVVDPVLYQWSAVNLQGRFVASQFAADSSLDQSSFSDSNSSGQAGVFLIFGGGYNNLQYDFSQTNVESTTSSESSFGLMRMTAVLEPRHDIGVPKPRHAIQGPHIEIAAGPIVNNGLTTRDMTVILTYAQPDTTPIADAVLSISTDGVPWTFSNAAQTTTDANGQLSIKLTRTFVDPTVDMSPVDVVVTARIGIVSTSTSVTF